MAHNPSHERYDGLRPEPDPGRATIVTLTMNPALDITTDAEMIGPTDKIRCGTPRYDPGGGGINVARVAHVLGGSVLAVFPAGGPTGGQISDLLREAGVAFHRVKIASSTRESFTVNERSSRRQYRFVLPGPRLSLAEQLQCLDQLRQAALTAEYVVASGSLPPGVAPNFYQQVADICHHLGVPLVLDTSGGGLTHIDSGVFVLKPSLRELRELSGRDLVTEREQVRAARDLVDRGVAQAVVVSMGADGAFLVTGRNCQRFRAIAMESGSGVGAGDAMVAAITLGLTRGWPLSTSVRYGTAAGAAMLLTPGTAVCNRTDVQQFYSLSTEPEEIQPDR